MSFDIVGPLGSHALLVFVLDVGVLLLLAGSWGRWRLATACRQWSGSS